MQHLTSPQAFWLGHFYQASRSGLSLPSYSRQQDLSLAELLLWHKRDKIKILFWERNGFVVWYKRLESERFKWPEKLATAASLTLTSQELNWLLDGYEALRI